MNAPTLPGGTLAHDPPAAALWEKLRTLSFDGGAGPNTFASRLAREQGWSAAFAGRVIEEYRRFLLLFALEKRRDNENPTASKNTATVQIVPSAAVDKVWHLHLLYTQSYWETLCRDILGQPLHHQPATGAGGEAGTLDAVYLANMEAYRRTFGELAPADIWPMPQGMPPPGMPLAEILGREDRPARFLNVASSFLAVGAIVVFVAQVVLGGMTSTTGSGLMRATWVLLWIIIAGWICTRLLIASIRRSAGPLRRDGKGGFFCAGGCGGSDGSSGSGGGHGHSHGSSDGGHSGGGGHSCGGHSCGGHGCGGHGCGGGH